jgi:hypothetical protein
MQCFDGPNGGYALARAAPSHRRLGRRQMVSLSIASTDVQFVHLYEYSYSNSARYFASPTEQVSSGWSTYPHTVQRLRCRGLVLYLSLPAIVLSGASRVTQRLNSAVVILGR